MKRRSVMTVFTVATLALVLPSLYAQWQYHKGVQLNDALDSVPEELAPDRLDQIRRATGSPSAPAVELAMANALLQAGHLAAAEPLLSTLSGGSLPVAISTAARLNLANAYLRDALQTDPGSSRHRSMIELAKQRYRELLADQPDLAPARYNLEIALRLSPEQDEYDIDERGKPIKSVSVVFPGFEDRELP